MAFLQERTLCATPCEAKTAWRRGRAQDALLPL